MKTALLAVLLLTFLILHPRITSSQPSTKPSVCEYKETREKVPINPETKKPYTPDERNQEPFAGASITKVQIKQCLQAKTRITNHHIVFEDYRDAWQELAEDTGDYAIPLKIYGGVFHANTLYDKKAKTGGIRLGAFRDPGVNNIADLTDKQRTTLSITGHEGSLVLIHASIQWRRVFIDSLLVAREAKRVENNNIIIVGATFSEGVDFIKASFIKGSVFNGATFSEGVDFSEATFTGYEHRAAWPFLRCRVPDP